MIIKNNLRVWDDSIFPQTQFYTFPKTP